MVCVKTVLAFNGCLAFMKHVKLCVTHLFSFFSMCNHKPQSLSIFFKDITAFPASNYAGDILVRFIDGLGYRYYWATDSLTRVDLAYKPSEDSRTTRRTLEHIHNLSIYILKVTQKNAIQKPLTDLISIPFDKLREQTLLNLKQSRDYFLKKPGDELINQHKITFSVKGNINNYSFWNLINGPIADMLYHTGQIVVFRRTTGNPINPKVNVFLGVNPEK